MRGGLPSHRPVVDDGVDGRLAAAGRPAAAVAAVAGVALAAGLLEAEGDHGELELRGPARAGESHAFAAAAIRESDTEKRKATPKQRRFVSGNEEETMDGVSHQLPSFHLHFPSFHLLKKWR